MWALSTSRSTWRRAAGTATWWTSCCALTLTQASAGLGLFVGDAAVGRRCVPGRPGAKGSLGVCSLAAHLLSVPMLCMLCLPQTSRSAFLGRHLSTPEPGAAAREWWRRCCGRGRRWGRWTTAGGLPCTGRRSAVTGRWAAGRGLHTWCPCARTCTSGQLHNDFLSVLCD